MFKSQSEKSYNLEFLTEKGIKNLIKKDKNLTKKELEELITTVTIYHKNQFKHVPEKLYGIESNKDLIDVANEDEKILIQLFEIDNLYRLLNLNKNYAKNKFENNDDFRRKIMRLSLNQIIEQGGKYRGAEYGLIFAKMFNFDISTPMHYASYDGMFDERFLKFYDTYLGIGGSEYTYWLPNYFDVEDKSRYSMEDLSDLTPQIKNYIYKYKINSKK